MNPFDLYLEYSKMYNKYLTRLMRVTNGKLIESTKQEYEKEATDYINKLGDNSFYIDKIRADITSINEKF